jgi:type III pantothenate kinase
MPKSLLAIDIGNSNIVVGLFRGKQLRWVKRFETAKGLVRFRKMALKSVDGIIVASVVPSLNAPLKKILKRRFKKAPIFIPSKTKLPIRLRVREPRQVGADRMANVVAAWVQFKKDCLVIDFGTATTFDVVSKGGDYLGGPIVPGVRMINEALHEKTAKLPLFRIARPKKVIGKTTRDCIQGGVFYGYLSLVEGLIKKIQKEYGKKLFVVATGGLAPLFVKGMRSVHRRDPCLTLRGLQHIFTSDK